MADQSRRLIWLQRWAALCALALIGSTWRLWTTATTFPRIPWFSWLCGVPGWCDFVAIAVLLAALAFILALAPWRNPPRWPRGRRAITFMLVPAGGLLLLLDQHRLQPWVYQFAWVFLILASARAERAFPLLRWLTIGIYLWSAISKTDSTFLTTTGPDLLRGVWNVLSLEPRALADGGAAFLSWAFPLGEFAVAALLAFPATRRLGLAASLLMHGALLLTLGPWGLNHEPGVLLWNVYFMGQNVLLFGARTVPDTTPERRWGLVECAVGLAMILPVLEPIGWLDHWPAWAVYAPGAERVTLLVNRDAADRLPAAVRDHLGPPGWRHGRRVVRTDQWSLETLSAPIYPQGRFRAAVALAIVRENQLGDGAVLVVESRANRLTGKRVRREYRGERAIARHVESYWFNTRARWIE